MYKQGDTLIFTSLTHASAAADLFGAYNIETQDYLGQWRKGFSVGIIGTNDFEASEWRIILDTPEKVGWFTAKAGDLVEWQRDGEPFRGIISNDDMTPDEYAALGLKPGVQRIIERNGRLNFPQPQEVKAGEETV